MPTEVLLIKDSRSKKLLGYLHRNKLPEGDLPETMVVGGRVFLNLEDDPTPKDGDFLRKMALVDLPVVGIYGEIGAVNFDAQRGTHMDRPSKCPITWFEGCAPIGETEMLKQ